MPRETTKSRRMVISALCISALVLGGCISSAYADTVIVDLPLRDGCPAAVCTVSGGAFNGAGWQVTGLDDIIRIDAGEALDSGIAEVDITNFDPPNNGRDWSSSENYCAIFSGFDRSPFDNSELKPQFSIISVWCDYETVETECTHSFRERSLKLGAIGSGGEGGSAWISSGGVDKEFLWDVQSTYHLRVEWDLAGVTFTATEHRPDGTTSDGSAFIAWNFTPEMPASRLRHFPIARNDGFCDPILNAVYSNLKITKRDDPCEGHCSNGTQDCGEEGVDCSGGCPACTACGDGGCDGSEDCHTCPEDCGECPEAEAEWPQERETGEEMPDAEVAGEEGTPEPGSDSDSGGVEEGGCSCGLVH